MSVSGQPSEGRASDAVRPVLEFPESLPVSARRAEIEAALREHQVIIVCGETGSGKTTQLPKIALAMGRGKLNAKPGQRPRLIGHTQPRRLAATSVAKRIAEETQTELGEVVGYKIRFQDRLSRQASVKLMTDGILLAETMSDPNLDAYDTLIIDEAHERSLNIDFLLGYIRQLLPRRPDLKVIVTSATIDADRFAEYFAEYFAQPARSGGAWGPTDSPKGRPQGESAPPGGSDPRSDGAWGPTDSPKGRSQGESAPPGGSDPRSGGAWGPTTKAPVLMVSGRTYPVEVRWRPFEESRDYDLNAAIADGVDELWRDPRAGDVLVFLPGEREIREAADHLRKHLSHQPAFRSAEVLPLFARLSQAEQEKIFHPHGNRRIVLATNVAETSLTVPGIRCVIDAGTARVKRYSLRQKVEQLLVEPISQAAANQRAGRCGRVAEGICIRLYDEQGFAARPRFTDPEILRSSLAGVILRMTALHLGAVEEFAFIEPPSRRAITDGYQLLGELGAVDEQLRLTPIGKTLARLPLDPRVGRMILEARERGALSEVLVLAAALSVQDVRDRPMDKQAQADQAHARFDDDKSEFVGTLRLWNWLEEARGGHGKDHKLSHRQYENLLRQHFIHVRRVREWRDTHTQLKTVVAEHGWKLGTEPASYEQLHLSMLSGLLGNVGCKSDSEDWYLGARGIKFHRHPGAHLKKRPGKWIVCAELVETSRLFGRGIAAIEPQWLETVGRHLLKKQLLDPHWEKKAARVNALERATLYGLPVYQQRRVDFAKVDAPAAREIFIREALVANLTDDTWDSKLPFLAANRKVVRSVQDLEHKSRRQDVLVDEELIFGFYDKQLPRHVSSGIACERWYRQASKDQPRLLHLSKDELMRHEAAGVTTQAFPRTIRMGGVDCAASYLHDPKDPRDGLSITVPIFALNQVSEARCDWLVPGMLKEKVQALLKSLHQRPRSRLVPLPQTAEAMSEQLMSSDAFGQEPLVDALLKLVREKTQLPVQRNDFKPDMLSPHHLMHFRVVDEHGRQLGQGRNLGALKSELGGKARGAFQALAALKMQDLRKAEPAAAQAQAQASDKKQARYAGQEPGQHARKQGKNSARDVADTFTDWQFGQLPELMEISKGSQTLVGFPALIDNGDSVHIEVFDEPELAAGKHRNGLRRLFALQVKDALKYLDKNLPGLQSLPLAYLQAGKGKDAGSDWSLETIREQILLLALERAFLVDPLPTDAPSFEKRVDEGRSRLTLIANEIARLVGEIMGEFAAAVRKLRDARVDEGVQSDVQQQLQRLMHKQFLMQTSYTQLQHFPRYLKAVQLRLEKWRADPARDLSRMSDLRPQEQRYWRLVSERKGVIDERMSTLRWMLEELRVSFFAQELRTPQPVSIKRLEKAWAQISL
ncbi:ATP-dependent RNA helicase HrpA [Hydrogenophaga sp. 5NK40-0174]|uniref:ATP-dependent RNA helicase HrpA n=1 Tax=Hydrogenophaga sp. 5NK40-0174 TaxID=3127649 RepID=UPI0033414AE6